MDKQIRYDITGHGLWREIHQDFGVLCVRLSEKKSMEIQLNDISVRLQLDTGSDINLTSHDI